GAIGSSHARGEDLGRMEVRGPHLKSTARNQMSVQVKGVVKRFGSFTALNQVNLEVRPGELLGLLGPSGSGKTTLLRIIGGLEFLDAGDVVLNGETVTRRSPAERGIGFVFQHYA